MSEAEEGEGMACTTVPSAKYIKRIYKNGGGGIGTTAFMMNASGISFLNLERLI